MEFGIDRAKLTAITAVLHALIASHPDPERLREAFDLFSTQSKDWLLQEPVSEEARRVHDDTLDVFGEAVSALKT